MNLIELHLLQSFPFTCLNRDDVGAPKSAIFGGVQRARVSSQCWKRAVRMRAFEQARELFAGKRGHYHSEALRDKLVELGIDENNAKSWAVDTFNALGKKGKNEGQTSVALYLSSAEIDSIAKSIVETVNSSGKGVLDSKSIAKAIKSAPHRDLADIAVFGRMVADDHSLMLEGAGLFSHALSTHAVANEIDFFSAVDDTKPTDDAGAGHIGVLEANSACYYRYVGLNLDLLFEPDHLASISAEDKRTVLRVFLRSVLEAVPNARKNSMFGKTLPQYAMAFVREGQPLSLVNAFEKPVVAKNKGEFVGYVEPSIKALKDHCGKLESLYGFVKDEQKFELGKKEDDRKDLSTFDKWLDQVVAAALEVCK